jgi:hypothetical protein
VGKEVFPLAVLDLEGEADRMEFALEVMVETATLPEVPLETGPLVKDRVAAVGDHEVSLLPQVSLERREVRVSGRGAVSWR